MGPESSAATVQSDLVVPAPARPLRALMLGNYHARFGTPGIVEQVAARLRETGVETVCASHRRHGLARAAHMLWSVWGRRDAYDVASVDLFSGRAFRWGEACAWGLARLEKPFALVLHGGHLPEFADAHPKRVRQTLARATRVLAPSAYLQRRLQPYRADIEVLPNPLDLPRYPYRLHAPAQPRLVWLRSFHEVYDAPLAVRVLARLRDGAGEPGRAGTASRSDWAGATLTMIGPDKGDGSRARTEAVARELGVADAVRFVGAVPKERVPALLAEADVFVNTTQVDNTPVSVLEAMACGLCVVSTNVGGLPDLVTHERDGLLVPPGDVEAMTAAVRRVVEEPALAATLSRQARETAARAGWDRVLPRWLRLLEALRDERAPREAG